MVRVADYISNFIHEKLKSNHVFMLSGGGAMFLNDAIAQNKNITVICNHHEQAGSIGAVAYAKYNNDFAVVIPTTGCGGTNCITGLLDAWQDNLKVFFISGQVNLKETTHGRFPNLRQIGVQEANIIDIVKPITKYAVMITDPSKIRYELEKAKFISETGRQGPVWIDVPMDIQSSMIDPDSLDPYVSPIIRSVNNQDVYRLRDKILTSERPIIIAGNGIKLSNSENEFREFVEKYNIPVVFTYLGIGVLPTNHPLSIGRIGVKGDRAGNFAMQNSDLVISIGSRLSPSMTGFKPDWFARRAKLICVDIDPDEHKKNHLRVDDVIEGDISDVLEILNLNPQLLQNSWWIEKCNYWKLKWNIFNREYDQRNGIDLYYFMKCLNENLKSNSIVVGDAGSAGYVPAQSIEINDNRKYIMPGAQMEMGFTLPACIGLSFRTNRGEVIGITGDGSFQLNLQELQTIKHYNLPIKLFVWNNNGYLSIRNTQDSLFEGRRIGTDSDSGISFPSLEKLANAYDIFYIKLSNSESLLNDIEKILNFHGPVLVEVICKPDQTLSPIVASRKINGKITSSPFEDMKPFLSKEEFEKEMIVDPLPNER